MDTTYGLLGKTLGHSWSPKIHALLGTTPYNLIELAPEELPAFIARGSWRGLNVTIPYKIEAARLADKSSDAVRRLGAANTLSRTQDGQVVADNTDLAGFACLLEDFCQREYYTSAAELLTQHEVVVLGTGGASKAICAALEDVGATPVCISRSGRQNYQNLTERHPHARLLINTTPCGMYPNNHTQAVSEAQLEQLPQLKGVLDIVYNPQNTRLVQTARKLGIPASGGLLMLVAQAARSAEIFTNHELNFSLQDVQNICSHIARDTTNIALIGMPGSGKTSAGRRLARLLHRPFVDLDDAFQTEAGMSAAAYISNYGEPAFRELESEQVAKYASQSGLVIACGGGVVVRDKNWAPLHQNSTVVMLNRPLNELSVEGRPVSQQKGIEVLAAERMSLYQSWADLIFDTTGSAASDAEQLAQLLGFELAH